jgi:cell division protein FtsB
MTQSLKSDASPPTALSSIENPTGSETHLQAKSLELEQMTLRTTQLEKTVKALLSRLEVTTATLAETKLDLEKKSKLVAKYEAYYKHLKSTIEKKEQQRAALSSTAPAVSSDPLVDRSVSPDNLTPNQLETDPNSPASALPQSPGQKTTRGSVQQLLMARTHSPLTILPPTSLLSGGTPPIATRHKNPTTSTLEASLQRNAALDRKK